MRTSFDTSRAGPVVKLRGPGKVPKCPHCGALAKLTDSAHVYRGRSYGLIWDCRPCDAYVGVHKGTTKPLGRLANRELRTLKIKAHAALDPLWRSGAMSRSEAYAYLAGLLGTPVEHTHIGWMNPDQCRRVLEVLQPSTPKEPPDAR